MCCGCATMCMKNALNMELIRKEIRMNMHEICMKFDKCMNMHKIWTNYDKNAIWKYAKIYTNRHIYAQICINMPQCKYMSGLREMPCYENMQKLCKKYSRNIQSSILYATYAEMCSPRFADGF
jgi:hypothetical protein